MADSLEERRDALLVFLFNFGSRPLENKRREIYQTVADAISCKVPEAADAIRLAVSEQNVLFQAFSSDPELLSLLLTQTGRRKAQELRKKGRFGFRR